ncbi:MAG: hypothetical protein E7172_05750, partial [Firmicutes bacterium]|nr:hypothetical protein [Bacillota bacterium]
GVGVRAPVAGGGYASFTGTSFATPIITGSVALMMQWLYKVPLIKKPLNSLFKGFLEVF